MVITMPDREDGPRFDPHGPDLVYVLIADDIAKQFQAGKLVPELIVCLGKTTWRPSMAWAR